MSCDKCPGKSKNQQFDKYGNPLSEEAEMLKHEHESHQRFEDAARNAASKQEMSYLEWKKMRDSARSEIRPYTNRIIETYSDDYKRIQIEELIAIYNHEDVSKGGVLTPNQALVALWEFAHHPAYQKVIGEFKGSEGLPSLLEQIDIKYNKLMKEKILVKWGG